MVGGRHFWLIAIECCLALTFLYNRLFHSLIYKHFVTSARNFCQSISLVMFCLLFCNCFSPLCIVICMCQNTKRQLFLEPNTITICTGWNTNPKIECLKIPETYVP